MDYFQGVVLEYLRADRSNFVNPEFWVRGNLESAHNRPHWFVDILTVNMKEKKVYLCEVTYAKQPRALVQRLRSWREHWETIEKTLREDTGVPGDWPLCPWVFATDQAMKAIEPELVRLFPDHKASNLLKTLPWEYCTYDRKEEIKQMEEERAAGHV